MGRDYFYFSGTEESNDWGNDFYLSKILPYWEDTYELVLDRYTHVEYDDTFDTFRVTYRIPADIRLTMGRVLFGDQRKLTKRYSRSTGPRERLIDNGSTITAVRSNVMLLGYEIRNGFNQRKDAGERILIPDPWLRYLENELPDAQVSHLLHGMWSYSNSLISPFIGKLREKVWKLFKSGDTKPPSPELTNEVQLFEWFMGSNVDHIRSENEMGYSQPNTAIEYMLNNCRPKDGHTAQRVGYISLMGQVDLRTHVPQIPLLGNSMKNISGGGWKLTNDVFVEADDIILLNNQVLFQNSRDQAPSMRMIEVNLNFRTESELGLIMNASQIPLRVREHISSTFYAVQMHRNHMSFIERMRNSVVPLTNYEFENGQEYVMSRSLLPQVYVAPPANQSRNRLQNWNDPRGINIQDVLLMVYIPYTHLSSKNVYASTLMSQLLGDNGFYAVDASDGVGLDPRFTPSIQLRHIDLQSSDYIAAYGRAVEAFNRRGRVVTYRHKLNSDEWRTLGEMHVFKITRWSPALWTFVNARTNNRVRFCSPVQACVEGENCPYWKVVRDCGGGLLPRKQLTPHLNSLSPQAAQVARQRACASRVIVSGTEDEFHDHVRSVQGAFVYAGTTPHCQCYSSRPLTTGTGQGGESFADRTTQCFSAACSSLSGAWVDRDANRALNGSASLCEQRCNAMRRAIDFVGGRPTDTTLCNVNLNYYNQTCGDGVAVPDMCSRS